VVVEARLVVLEAVPVLAEQGHVPAERSGRGLAVLDPGAEIAEAQNEYKKSLRGSPLGLGLQQPLRQEPCGFNVTFLKTNFKCSKHL
jgi:hypothetical protein